MRAGIRGAALDSRSRSLRPSEAWPFRPLALQTHLMPVFGATPADSTRLERRRHGTEGIPAARGGRRLLADLGTLACLSRNPRRFGAGRGGAGRGRVAALRRGRIPRRQVGSARGPQACPERQATQRAAAAASGGVGAARRPPQVEPLRVGGAGGGTGHCRGLRSRRHRLSGEGKHTRGALSRRNGRGDPCTAVPPVPSAPSPLGAGRREPDQSRHRSGAARRAAAQHTGSTRDPAGGFADRVIIHGRESMALNHDSHLTTIRATPSYRVARGCRSAIPCDPAESVLTVTLLSDSEPRVVRRRLRAEPPGSGRRPSPALHAASGGSQPRVAPATDDGGRLATEADGG